LRPRSVSDTFLSVTLLAQQEDAPTLTPLRGSATRNVGKLIRYAKAPENLLIISRIKKPKNNELK